MKQCPDCPSLVFRLSHVLVRRTRGCTRGAKEWEKDGTAFVRERPSCAGHHRGLCASNRVIRRERVCVLRLSGMMVAMAGVPGVPTAVVELGFVHTHGQWNGLYCQLSFTARNGRPWGWGTYA